MDIPVHEPMAILLLGLPAGLAVLDSDFFLGGIRPGRVECGNMTRPAIESCIRIFIVLLVATFVWTATRVLGMLGWF